MPLIDANTINAALANTWSSKPSSKAKAYIGKFFNTQLRDSVILAKVAGNHGTYTVSLALEGNRLEAHCSCYKGGYCHHSEALAHTYVMNAKDFKIVKSKTLKQVKTLDDLNGYLKGVTLENLIQQLKSKGITQKDFAESVGMSTRHLSAVKSSELKNRYFHELGATKLACLWVIEHLA
jgi:uncharacterized Zn finger protein